MMERLYKVVIVIIIVVFLLSKTSVKAAEEELSVLDQINITYKTVTDWDMYRGIVSLVTNGIGYLTNTTDKEEYEQFANDFATYMNNYDLVIDDMIEYDPSTKTISIKQDMQKHIIQYLNMDSFTQGHKIVSNPALSARALAYLNESVAGQQYGSRIVEAFYNLATNDFLYVVNVGSTTDYPGFIYYSYLPDNIKYGMGAFDLAWSSLGTSPEPYNKILYSNTNTYNFIYFTLSSSVTHFYQQIFNGGANFGTGYTSRDKSDFKLVNKPISEIKGDEYFLVGNGSRMVNLPTTAVDITKPLYGNRYVQWQPNQVMRYNIEYVLFGDHYKYYNDNRTIINNYYTTDIDWEKLREYIDEINKDKQYEINIDNSVDNNYGGELVEKTPGILSIIFGELLGIIGDLTGFLLKGITGLIGNMFKLISIPLYIGDIGNSISTFFEFVKSVFGALPSGIKSALSISFIGIISAVLIKKTIL